MSRPTTAGRWPIPAALILASACDGPQSALSPAGRDALLIADLFWWMAAAAVVIWLVMLVLVLVARRGGFPVWTGHWLIGAGVAVPVVALTVLVFRGLPVLPQILALPPPGGLSVEITGEQWWWRVRYHRPDGSVVELANELRLPVGRRVELRLRSADVIHAFWVPSLAGKVDMIPGRVTRLAVEPTETGTFRGACAEYCGASHARMHMVAIVEEEAAFEAWLDGQAAPAAAPDTDDAARGAQVFGLAGCGACHTVRGTPADGSIAPDLTHVGSRWRLAAGAVANTPDGAVRWLSHPDVVKAGARMPAFGMLTADELEALAAYLAGLR